MKSVLLPFRNWLNHKLYFLDSVFERFERQKIHSQVSDDHAVVLNAIGMMEETHRGKADMGDPVVMAHGSNAIKKDDWGTQAADGRYASLNAGNLLDDDWRRFVGFFSHDGTPHLWDDEKNAWT